MLKVNEYFSGNVKSIGFDNGAGTATVGVMLPGEYEFGTSQPEIMRVLSGSLEVKLPGQETWQVFGSGSQFSVPGDSRFQLKVQESTAYLCEYH